MTARHVPTQRAFFDITGVAAAGDARTVKWPSLVLPVSRAGVDPINDGYLEACVNAWPEFTGCSEAVFPSQSMEHTVQCAEGGRSPEINRTTAFPNWRASPDS